MTSIEKYKTLVSDFSPVHPKEQVIRVNTLLSEVSELSRLSPEKIAYLTNGYRIPRQKFALASTPEYLLGKFYIQGSAAQVPVEVLDPQPGEYVLDACAAPGGKTTQIAARMKNKGVLVALEVKGNRLQSLRNNIERCGVANTIVYHCDLLEFPQEHFDRILLDAPCSGNYCSEPNWFELRTEKDVKERARLQKELILKASTLLKPGGVLVYSTCSLEPEENEEIVSFALKHSKLKLQPCNIAVGDPGLTEETKECRRFWPHRTQTEGFFVAKFVLCQ